MKYNSIFFTVIIFLASLSTPAMAQRGRHASSRPGYSYEARNPHRVVRRGHRHPGYGRPSYHVAVSPRRYHAVPVVDRYGYLPGWEGRVRYVDGRWGYFRDSRWLWYDTYYAPEYYYSQPVYVFQGRLSPAGKVAAGVVGTVAVASLISALVH